MLQAERPPLALQLLFLGKHLGYLMERRLAGRGLNRTQTMILTALARHPGLKALDLCGPARVEPANVTRTLQSLERLGLLERRPHPTDGRASLFYLTDAGLSLAGELAGEVESLSADLLQGMPADELAQMQRALDLVRRNLGGMLRATHRDGEEPPARHQGCHPKGEGIPMAEEAPAMEERP